MAHVGALVDDGKSVTITPQCRGTDDSKIAVEVLTRFALRVAVAPMVMAWMGLAFLAAGEAGMAPFANFPSEMDAGSTPFK